MFDVYMGNTVGNPFKIRIGGGDVTVYPLADGAVFYYGYDAAAVVLLDVGEFMDVPLCGEVRTRIKRYGGSIIDVLK